MATLDIKDSEDLEEKLFREKQEELDYDDSSDEEEGEIHLPEDKFAGRVLYFLWVWIFAGGCLSTAYDLFRIISLPYLIHEVFFKSRPWLFKWIFTVHFVLLFVGYLFLWMQNNEKFVLYREELETLLEEVAEANFFDDLLAWKRIAFRVNKQSMENGYRYTPFYSGSHCRNFFAREIVKPIVSRRFKIKHSVRGHLRYHYEVWNKDLALEAVSSYQDDYANSTSTQNSEHMEDVPLPQILSDVICLITVALLIELVLLMTSLCRTVYKQKFLKDYGFKGEESLKESQHLDMQYPTSARAF